MRVLILYAHPNPKSFNHAVLENFVRGLKDGGHTSEVVDLYASKFNPCIMPEDFAQFTGGQMPQDVLDQQEKVAAAEALVFIHPKWGYGFPAILEGWLQRVFSHGFAYRASEKGMEGLLKHKKSLLINTTALPKEFYEAYGLIDAFTKMSVATIKHSAGIQIVDQVSFYSLTTVDDETRKKYLKTAYRLGKEF
jgi:NAD(P)H dehydrogenase (quinone)